MISTILAIIQTSTIPSPPQILPEFFSSTVQTHSIMAPCHGSRASIAWKFDGSSSRISYITFGSFSPSQKEIDQVDRWMKYISGDVLIRLECDSSDAIVTLIESRFAGSSAAKSIRFLIHDHTLKLINDPEVKNLKL